MSPRVGSPLPYIHATFRLRIYEVQKTRSLPVIPLKYCPLPAYDLLLALPSVPLVCHLELAGNILQ